MNPVIQNNLNIDWKQIISFDKKEHYPIIYYINPVMQESMKKLFIIYYLNKSMDQQSIIKIYKCIY